MMRRLSALFLDQNRIKRSRFLIEGEKDARTKPDWKDYVAIAVALVETILLPIVIILVFLIVILAIVVIK
jgi:hypothetical protein